MPEFETIRYEVRDSVAWITLARPERRNAMNRKMFVELAEAAEQASDDERVRGIVLSGEGSSFCAGLDLSMLGELAGIQGARFRSFVRLAQRPFALLAGMPKPSLAAVQGHALGAGCQLALACDLRVAAADARFSIMEAKYGLIPDLGGPHRLARLVGPARAKELIWTTRAADAEEAERIGLANRVVSPDQLSKEAEALVLDVLAHSPVTIGLVKDLVDRASETPLEVEFEREATAQNAAIGSSDHAEAVAAFLEKRPPRFTGR